MGVIEEHNVDICEVIQFVLFAFVDQNDITKKSCRRPRIEAIPTALQRTHALDSAATAGLGRATPHASPR